MASITPPADDKSAELDTFHHDMQNSMNNSASKGFDHRGDNSKSGFDYRHDVSTDDDSVGKNAGVEMGYLPPDQRSNMPGELFSQLVDPDIDDDTEAAEALRANAGVKVGKVGKVARSLNAQSVRKLAKRVTMRGNNGYRRGKPPRIPPGMANANASAGGEVFMYPLSEEDEMAQYGGEDDDSQSTEPPRDIQPSVSDEKNVAPATSKDYPSLAPPGAKESHVRDEGSYVSPSHGGETDPSKREKNRHSTLLEEAKDIPAEVVAATMEAGRKCKFLGVYLVRSVLRHKSNRSNDAKSQTCSNGSARSPQHAPAPAVAPQKWKKEQKETQILRQG
jgi:hypothetical protein